MDYKSLGLRVGIEIHQRLDTKKLFCDCASQQQDEPVSIIKRKLRPSSGEMGKIDAAALHEFLRDRNFVYSLYPSETCLVESDEEPPHELNREALAISMQACKLLNCDIPEEIHVMRKTVIDGSNTTGFQRTAVIGLNGSIDGTKINSVCLEEEAARIEIREGETTYYKLNGLGIPLIEITTDSSINTPEEAKEIAEKIGFLLRSLKVQRGIGSIRQDVNISIRDGARNEIKGFQELKDIPKLIENEIARQLALIEIKNELHRRGVKLNIEQKDVTDIFKKSKSAIIKKQLEDGGHVVALLIHDFSGLLKKQCGDRTFAKELVGYIEPFGLKGFIHSDEDLEKYELINEFNELKKIFDAEERDVILIIAGENLEKAIDSLTIRIKEALSGVPEETRAADGLGSKYARPLPGAERMYPETDVPPIETLELIKFVKIPKTLAEKEEELKKILPKDIAEQLVKSKELNIFEELLETAEPILIATTLLFTIKELRRKGLAADKIDKNKLEKIFLAVKSKKISKDSVPQVLEKIAMGEETEKSISSFSLISEKELEDIVHVLAKKNKGLSEQALMGLIMKNVRGRADGSKVMELIRREMKE